MHRLRLIVLCILACSLTHLPVRAEDTEPSAETVAVQAEIAELTVAIDAATRQIGDFGNDTPEKQKVLFKLVVDLCQRAQKRQRLQLWNEAQYDWFLADFYRERVVFGTYLALLDSSVDLKVWRAWACYNAGDLDDARRWVMEAQADSNWAKLSPQLFLFAAHINLYSNALDDAMKDARAALATEAGRRNVFITLSLIYYRLGDLANARKFWTQVGELDAAYKAADPFDPRVAELNAALVRSPRDPQAWSARADAYYRAGSSGNGARDSSNASAPGFYLHNPPSFQKFSGGQTAFLDAAQHNYTQSLKLADDPAVTAKRALTLYEISQLREPDQKPFFPRVSTWEKDLKAARHKGQTNFDAMLTLGTLQRLIAAEAKRTSRPGDEKAAIAESNAFESMAVAHHPEHPQAEAVRNAIAQQTDQMIEATLAKPIPYEERALATPARSAEAWKQLGNQANGSGDAGLALHYYQQALAKDPTYADALSNIGNLYAERGDLTRALAAWRNAIELEPRHRIAHRNLAINLARIGLIEEAIIEADAAVKFAVDPAGLAAAFAVRGQVRVKMGDIDAGIADWQARVELQPNDAGTWQLIGKEALFNADIDTAISALRRNLELEPHNTFTQIFLAMAINADAMRQRAEVLGKPIEDLPYGDKDVVYPAALELVENLQLSDADKDSIVDTWNDRIERSPFIADRALGRNGQAVLKFVIHGKR